MTVGVLVGEGLGAAGAVEGPLVVDTAAGDVVLVAGAAERRRLRIPGGDAVARRAGTVAAVPRPRASAGASLSTPPPPRAAVTEPST